MGELLGLSNISYAGVGEAGELLLAYAKSRPDDWYDEGVRLAYNSGNGDVFLTNIEGQMLVLEDGKAVMLYSLPYGGSEGTLEQLWSDFGDGDIDERDYEELAEIFEYNHMDKRAEKIREDWHNGQRRIIS